MKKSYTIYKGLKVVVKEVSTPWGMMAQPIIKFGKDILFDNLDNCYSSDIEIFVNNFKAQLNRSDKLALSSDLKKVNINENKKVVCLVLRDSNNDIRTFTLISFYNSINSIKAI